MERHPDERAWTLLALAGWLSVRGHHGRALAVLRQTARLAPSREVRAAAALIAVSMVARARAERRLAEAA